MTASVKKSAMALAIAGTFAAAIPPVEADVINLSWSGAFTWINPTGLPITNSPPDYQWGYYSNGDSGSGYGAPYFPGNVGPNADCTTYAPTCITAHGWYGGRTPISGTLAFDTVTGAGVGTINPFFWLGETPGSGPGTHVARFLNPTFQAVDTVGTIVGTMLLSWNGAGHSLSIVLDGTGLFSSLGSMMASGPTASVSGVGALPATDGTNFGTIKTPHFLALGPSPIATKTLNALGCEAQSLATQVAPWAIIPTGNIANCDLSQDDGIGGSPAVSTAFQDFNFNFDFMSAHLEPSVVCTSCPPVPAPPAIWLFGSGLLGLVGLARRRDSKRK